MKRAILLLTTALLGLSGCRDCLNTITVQWAFKDAAGNLLDCSQASVATAHVFLDGRAQFDQFGSTEFTCAQFPNGVILTDYPGGTHLLQIDALDQNGNLLYQFHDNISARNCGDTTLPIDVPAVVGPLDINYRLPVAQCPVSSFVWFSITDLSTQQPAIVIDGLHTPEQFPCGQTIPLPLDVPFGDYRLDFIQIVQKTSNIITPYVAVYQNCTPGLTVHHTGVDLFDVTLASATSTCQ